MKNRKACIMIALLLGMQTVFAQKADYNITPIPFNKVRLTDSLRLRLMRRLLLQ